MSQRLGIIFLLISQLFTYDTLVARSCGCRCGQKRPILYDYNKQTVDPREGKHLYPMCQRPRYCKKNMRTKAQ